MCKINSKSGGKYCQQSYNFMFRSSAQYTDMTAVRPSPRFNVIRKWTKTRLTQRGCRKVFIVAANDSIADVSERSNKDSLEDGFCGEPFADNGELLSSLSPLMFGMKLFGLYFHREPRHRPRTDDPEWNPTTTTTGTTSTKLRVYATAVLILMWLNFFRSVFVFNNSDHFGSRLLIKMTIFAWFGLIAILQSAYYFASHTGQLLEVLLTLPVTSDCVVGVRRNAVGMTVFTWLTLIINAAISSCFFFVTDGYYDFTLAPLVTYIKVPEDKLIIARGFGNLLYFVPIPCSLFAEVMTVVLVYVFYHQFRKLKKHFRRALGERGQFSGDLSAFRRRHQTLSRAVNKVDGFMRLSNVAGFVCHTANIIVLFYLNSFDTEIAPNRIIIVLLYSIVFSPDSTSTSVSSFIYLSILSANIVGLLFAASAGIIVNHMVRRLLLLFYSTARIRSIAL